MNDAASPAISLREIDTTNLVSIEDNREAIEFGVKAFCRAERSLDPGV